MAIVYGKYDTHISSLQPDTNYGSIAAPMVGWIVNKYEARCLLQADLSLYIPAGSTIVAATLYLWIETISWNANSLYKGFRIKTENRPWVEMEATWNIYKTGSSWQTAGGFGIDDQDVTVTFGGAWNPPNQQGWTSVDCTSFVQDAWTNRGKLFDCVLEETWHPPADQNANFCFEARDDISPWYIYVNCGGVIKKISGVAYASVKKVSGVANPKKISGVAAN